MELTKKEVNDLLDLVFFKNVDISELDWLEDDWEHNRDNHYILDIYVMNGYNEDREKDYQLTPDEYHFIQRLKRDFRKEYYENID